MEPPGGTPNPCLVSFRIAPPMTSFPTPGRVMHREDLGALGGCHLGLVPLGQAVADRPAWGDPSLAGEVNACDKFLRGLQVR